MPTTPITNLSISYPDFKLQEIIDPDQFDINNADIVNKVNEIISMVNSNTTTIEGYATSKADKSYVDSQNSNLQNQINTINTTLSSHTTSINNLATQKADKTYVDAQISFIQSGQIVDNAVSTSKIQNGAVTNPKIADGAITASKVDNVTVYTGAKTDTQIANAVSIAQNSLQAQINTHTSNINAINTSINQINTRIDNLQYNVDLYSAKQDIITLTLNVELLKGSALTGVSENMVIETLADVSDLIVTNGLYDATNKKIYLP